MRKLKMGFLISAMMVAVAAVGAEKFISFNTQKGYYPLIENGKPAAVYIDQKVDSAVIIAAENLSKDFQAVCGERARISRNADSSTSIIVTTVGSPVADRLIKNKSSWETGEVHHNVGETPVRECGQRGGYCRE